MAKKRQKAQEKIFAEIQSQLTVKAKKLGIEDRFTPEKLEEMELEAQRGILDDLNAEKSNLEYELYMKGVLDQESKIKLEKINMYIIKANRLIEQHGKTIEKMTGKVTTERAKGKEAADKLTKTSKISISK